MRDVSLERRHCGVRAMPSKYAENLAFEDMHIIIGEKNSTFNAFVDQGSTRTGLHSNCC